MLLFFIGTWNGISTTVIQSQQRWIIFYAKEVDVRLPRCTPHGCHIAGKLHQFFMLYIQWQLLLRQLSMFLPTKWIFNLYDLFVENTPEICHCSQLYKHSWLLIGCVGFSDIFLLNALIIFIWPPFTFY